MLDKNANVSVREVDTAKYKYKTIEEKVGKNYYQVDVKAQNSFTGQVEIQTLEHVTGYDYYRKRNSNVNRGLVTCQCLRHNAEERYNHIIRCKGFDLMQ